MKSSTMNQIASQNGHAQIFFTNVGRSKVLSFSGGLVIEMESMTVVYVIKLLQSVLTQYLTLIFISESMGAFY